MIRPVARAADRRTTPWRAVTAVLGLYALVLHAALTGLMPFPATADHGVRCLGQVDGGPAEAGAPDGSHHGHLPCCTVPAAFSALVPDNVARPVAWPPRIGRMLAWPHEPPRAAHGPPGTIAHPRGPPAV